MKVSTIQKTYSKFLEQLEMHREGGVPDDMDTPLLMLIENAEALKEDLENYATDYEEALTAGKDLDIGDFEDDDEDDEDDDDEEEDLDE